MATTMEELKQKANAYDEALERAKEYLKDSCISKNTIAYLEDIFPELKESEDDRIRKSLIDLVKCNERSGYTLLNNVSTSSMLAWLEKQVPIDEEKVLIGARKDVALSIMDFLDRNTLGMCLSNMECKDLEDAIVDSDWSKVYDYMKKKLGQQEVTKISDQVKDSDWSKEDEHRIGDTIYFLDTAKKHYASTVELDACIDWLKSLKQRIGG